MASLPHVCPHTNTRACAARTVNKQPLYYRNPTPHHVAVYQATAASWAARILVAAVAMRG